MATTSTSKPLTVVIVGIGQMGRSHALAYHKNPSFQIIGLVNRSPMTNLSNGLETYPILNSFDEALRLKPDVISVNTHVETHAPYAIAALESGSHVFVEKPLSASVEDSERVVATARRTGKKLIIGYILRHHPSWQTFIHRARDLGPPFVFRMNLNQQSSGAAWEIHKKLMEATSPVVDCGVHYIDVMLQITDSKPVQVRGMGVRLSEEIDESQVNYGHLQVIFEDGSVGWYEAGWGPMISETAYSVKDVMGPKGSVSIIGEEGASKSDNVDGHTKTSRLKVHSAKSGQEDEILEMKGEPGHQELCELEQQYVCDVIRGDLDLEKHWADAIRSQMVVLAADLSMREKRAVDI